MTFEHFRQLVDTMLLTDGAGGIAQKYSKVEPRELNPLVAAYIGDAYFHLFVRGRLLSYEQNKVQVLNEFGAQIVSAHWQSVAYIGIEEMLSEEEKGFFRRGRNAKSHPPRKATVGEYHNSTGFEALLGTLYLLERFDRLYEVAEASFKEITKQMLNVRLEGEKK